MKKRLLLLSVLTWMSLTANAQFWDITDAQKLPGTVNTPTTEESIPTFSKDSSLLYFVRTYDSSAEGGEEDQDIWSSKREKDGSYSDCKRVTDLNNKYNNAILGMNKTGDVVYLLNAYEGKKDLIKGIAMSTKKGNSWEKPVAIEIPGLNIKGDFYSFHVSDDGNVIIISHAGPGTIGQEDFFVSTKSGTTWSAPIHMGNVINSTGFEISPFLSVTQDTLFFSSNGHGGLGDADIFYSVKQGSWTSWSKPVNVGSKINSPKFDAYFNYSGNQMYWSSNKDGELSDIYTANVKAPPAVSVVCQATNATTHKGSDGKVDATTSGGVPPFTYNWSNGTKTEDATGLTKGEYTITVTDAIGQTANSSCTVGEPGPPQDIALKHYFEYNGDKFMVADGKLKDFVQQIETQLNNGREKVKINIYSSASNVPTTTFGTNDKLARSRADQIKKELTSYFDKKGLSKKIKIEIVSSVVSGPKYDNDPQNTGKYREFQFIELKTE